MLRCKSLLPIDKTKLEIQSSSDDSLENSKGNFKVIQGDALTVLKTLPDKSVQCCITSPPYWGLRDYGTAKWEGGDKNCDHNPQKPDGGQRSDRTLPLGRGGLYRNICGKCDAIRIDDQIGLEESPEEYVDKLVEIFREVHRVLRNDGVLFLNLGDSYYGSWGNYGGKNRGAGRQRPIIKGSSALNPAFEEMEGYRPQATYPHKILKPKDLIGIPWLVAKALQAPYYIGKIKVEGDRIWLAAMIEAEGCLFIHKRKAGQNNGQGYKRQNDSYGAGLEVASTDRVVVERCLAITGLGSICEQTPIQNDRRKQTIYRWNLRSNVCREVIQELYPHFIAKQHEARLLLGCPSSGIEAAKTHESLKAIHQGGKPTIDFPAPKSLFEPGWYLRSDIIWAKKNCMPESVTDRPTRNHEDIFLLTKSSRYYYDAKAVEEPLESSSIKRLQQKTFDQQTGGPKDYKNNQNPNRSARRALVNLKGRAMPPQVSDSPGQWAALTGRNLRDVWFISTQPFKDAHFAVFPEKLVEPCILAGTSPKACGICGAPWERIVKKDNPPHDGMTKSEYPKGTNAKNLAILRQAARERGEEFVNKTITLGWQPICNHNDDTGKCLVLDPFSGSGTTGVVAKRYRRKFIGIELNKEYIRMSYKRARTVIPVLVGSFKCKS